MDNFVNQFLAQLAATSVWEWLAVILALAYLILAIRENIWCWVAAFFSTAIYIFLFFDVNLYMESALNIFYLVMAIYGWFRWRNGEHLADTKAIVSWSSQYHLILIFITLAISIVSGWLLNNYTSQDYAYLDSFTTWFAILTTVMVAEKVLQNWLYWLIIDSVSIYLYLQKGLALTSLLFLIYLGLAWLGWIKWKHHYARQNE
ncbi:MAG: nicotinamide riboside transporter PnuC [Gammaproteobacteria bacterium]|nr:nicotinamide riboside transporter PnuC [Gammaproteobacteria bacterium]MDH5629178.1 nicotinamide riboside transporter PnuC [Gammaproteobacteria bacterium]